MRDTDRLECFRGHIVHCLANPLQQPDNAVEHFPDGLLIIANGHVLTAGPWSELHARLPADAVVHDYRGCYLVPGFIDTHIHYSQTDMIASRGENLLDWLEHYTYPTEAAFICRKHADEVARFFCEELLRNGTTTAMSFATVHPDSAEALFQAAYERGMRLIGGKVLMDRHCPDDLKENTDLGISETRALIERWHGRDRLLYAISPRFAPTSTRRQMQLTGELFRTYPGVYLQSHLAESPQEVAWVNRLYPEARSYLDVYERFGHLGPRSIFAHCLWIDDTDLSRMADSGAAISFCPTSNLFLGSGLFDLFRATQMGIEVGLGTDVGAGTSFSLLRTLAEAYKVLKLNGQNLTAEQALYLATLGGARSLRLDDYLGNFRPGMEADFVVLDPAATPLMARRTGQARNLSESLFSLVMLSEDRTVQATYLMGRLAWQRSDGQA